MLRNSASLLLAIAGFLKSSHSYKTIDDISFGHKSKISNPSGDIPGWTVSGENHQPDILSDRVILTPPYPGSKRGAAWADNPINQENWAVDLEFRASGPERGHGSLQVWLTKDGSKTVDLSSIYFAPAFDGLAIVIDQYGGKGGSVRGFLNDASVAYKGHHDVDSLSFGQCDYSYRNRGEFSRLRIRQLNDNFAVLLDDKVCFESNKIEIPVGYTLGASAVSAEHPDSFELRSFIASTPEAHDFTHVPMSFNEPGNQQAIDSKQQPLGNTFGNSQSSSRQSSNQNTGSSGSTSGSGMTSEQYADLQSRLSTLDRQLNTLMSEFALYKKAQDKSHEDNWSQISSAMEAIHDVDRITNQVHQNVLAIKREVDNKEHIQHLTNLHDAVQETRSALSAHLPQTIKTIKSAVPSLGMFIFIVIGFQGMLAVSYFWYKHRRNTMPKKFL